MSDEEVQQLTEDEIRRLRQILDQDDKMKWLYGISRKLGAWIFGISAALVAFRNDLRALMAWAGGG